VESARAIILRMDPEGRILSINSYGEELLGFSRRDLLGRDSVGNVFPERDSHGNDMARIILESSKDRSIFPIVETVDRDGNRVSILWSNMALPGEGGETREIICVGINITDRQKEEDLLGQAVDAFRPLNKRLRHDVMNQLCIISGALEVYRKKGKESFLKDAAQAVEKSASILERMRDLETLIDGRCDMKVRSLSRIIRMNLHGKEHSRMVELEGDCEMLMDASLVMAIEELIENSVRHSGTPRVHVRIEDMGSRCRITVSDRGAGIPPENVGRIVEMGFSQGESAGDGMGLYLVSKVVEKYGGEMSIVPTDPQGTTVMIEVPHPQ